jgi:hypothetical protein
LRRAKLALKFRGLGHVYLDIIRACGWYREIGISISGSRLEKIHAYVENRLLSTSTPEALELETLTPRVETYHALSDGAAFGLIAQQLSSLPSSLIPRRTLRDILQGPLVPTEETASSSDGRNKFVELELAAHISSAGFDLKGFDDVVFEFEGVRYLVECKRPFREATVEENIDKAYGQLRTKLGGSSDRGIVAIAIDKVLNLDRVVYNLPTPSSVPMLGRFIAGEFFSSAKDYQREWIDPRVVGIFAVVRFLSKTEIPQSIGPSYNLALLIIASPHLGQEADFERLLRMTNKIQGSFNGAGWETQNPGLNRTAPLRGAAGWA